MREDERHPAAGDCLVAGLLLQDGGEADQLLVKVLRHVVRGVSRPRTGAARPPQWPRPPRCWTRRPRRPPAASSWSAPARAAPRAGRPSARAAPRRSEEHTSELQSRGHLVCRLLLEKK